MCSGWDRHQTRVVDNRGEVRNMATLWLTVVCCVLHAQIAISKTTGGPECVRASIHDTLWEGGQVQHPHVDLQSFLTCSADVLETRATIPAIGRMTDWPRQTALSLSGRGSAQIYDIRGTYFRPSSTCSEPVADRAKFRAAAGMYGKLSDLLFLLIRAGPSVQVEPRLSSDRPPCCVYKYKQSTDVTGAQDWFDFECVIFIKHCRIGWESMVGTVAVVFW